MSGQDTAFAVKKWHMYVGLAIGILTLGSMLGLKVITPGQTAVADAEKTFDAKILVVARKHGQDHNIVIKELKDLELRMNKDFSAMLNENNKVLAQLIARKQNGN